MKRTGDPSLIKTQLHDFGFRGVSSYETSASKYNPNQILFFIYRLLVGACAHLTSFYGTDTISGCILAQKYYLAHKIAANSIPATEHSTMVSWSRAKECDAYENILSKTKFQFEKILY